MSENKTPFEKALESVDLHELTATGAVGHRAVLIRIEPSDGMPSDELQRAHSIAEEAVVSAIGKMGVHVSSADAGPLEALVRTGWNLALAALAEWATSEAAGRQVHAAWVAGMQRQYRTVDHHRRRWDSLAQHDRDLDASIATDLALAAGKALAVSTVGAEPHWDFVDECGCLHCNCGKGVVPPPSSQWPKRP
jgi:hypothetical protein